MRLEYPARAVEKEYSKFLNRLHRVKLPYQTENEAKLTEIINLGEGWKEHDKEALELLCSLLL